MRLWRFVGDRAARQAILFERAFAADSAAGQLICDSVVPDGEMDAALARTVEALTSSGAVSAAGNRKAMRIGQESVDLFRQYMAMYCREQAYCHYSPAADSESGSRTGRRADGRVCQERARLC